MNSSNKKPIYVAVALLLLFVLLYFAFMRPKSVSETQNAQEANEAMMVDDGTSVFSGSLLDLAKAGGNMTCKYSLKDTEYTMEGTSYISGKNMRVDSEIAMSDQPSMTSHMVSDGEWIYVWSSAMPQGMKMKFEEPENMATDSEATTPTNEQVDKFKQNMDFKCGKWVPDNSQFALPKNVEFTDFSAQMQQAVPNACAACSYMQDAAQKAECLSALKCE